MSTKTGRPTRATPVRRAARGATVAPTGNGQAAGPAVESRDSITDVWGERTPYFGEWAARADERREETPQTWV